MIIHLQITQVCDGLKKKKYQRTHIKNWNKIITQRKKEKHKLKCSKDIQKNTEACSSN